LTEKVKKVEAKSRN